MTNRTNIVHYFVPISDTFN